MLQCLSLRRGSQPFNSLKCIHNRRKRNFTVLALESSADDTCAAVVTSEREILSNVVLSQHDIHVHTGGIRPDFAIYAHQRNLPGAIRRALREANRDMGQIDGIAFTRGPGMAGCLSVSSNAAKNLAAALNKPLVGVHHMQAHALTPLLSTPTESLPRFPFLTLLISGGHTMLVLANSLTSFKILATTHDASIGRAFDKVARELALSWGAQGYGAELESFCRTSELKYRDDPGPDAIALSIHVPVPMRGELQFSYSGPHSYMEQWISNRDGIQNIEERTRWRLAEAFQQAAAAQLEEKVELAWKKCHKEGLAIQDLIVSGGVASNRYIRERLTECLTRIGAETSSTINLLFPPQNLCRDNAVMIAWASMHRFLAGDYDEYSVEHRAKWSIEEL